MKITSFNVSKKLAEVGFRADYFFCYDNEGILHLPQEGSIPAYELEVLIKSIKKENESLADCVGRLLILLHEEGIINFNE